MQPHDDSSSVRKGHIPSRLHHPPPPCGHDPHLRRTLVSRQLRHRSASVYTEVTRVILDVYQCGMAALALNPLFPYRSTRRPIHIFDPHRHHAHLPRHPSCSSRCPYPCRKYSVFDSASNFR